MEQGPDINTLHNLELRHVRLEEKVEAAAHDIKNVRTQITALSHIQDTRHGQLEADIKELGRILFRIGLSLVGSIFALLLGLVAYFMSQRDHSLSEIYKAQLRQEQSK